MRTQHCTASHSITLPCSTTTWYSSTITCIPSHAQTLYLQRDTNMSSYINRVHKLDLASSQVLVYTPTPTTHTCVSPLVFL